VFIWHLMMAYIYKHMIMAISQICLHIVVSHVMISKVIHTANIGDMMQLFILDSNVMGNKNTRIF